MKKIIGAIVAVVAVAGGFMWWNHEQEEIKAGEDLAKKALENTPDVATFANSTFISFWMFTKSKGG